MLMRRGCYPAAPTSRWSRSASATAASARPRGTSTPSRTLTRPHSMPSPRCVIDEAQDKHASGCVTPETPSGPGPGTASVAGVVVRDPGRLQLDHAPGGVVHLRYRQAEPDHRHRSRSGRNRRPTSPAAAWGRGRQSRGRGSRWVPSPVQAGGLGHVGLGGRARGMAVSLVAWPGFAAAWCRELMSSRGGIAAGFTVAGGGGVDHA